MGLGKIVSVHSYRGGTGKSNLTANLAASLVRRGCRVAVLDTDIQSPGVHVLFGFDADSSKLSLVDFLWGRCTIEETAYDVTERTGATGPGRCWLIPSSMQPETITRLLDEGYDVNRLNTHFNELLEGLDLDFLMIDTHPGLNKETMLSTAISDHLILIVRPDQQDFHGTAIVSQIASRLEVPSVFVVANKVLSMMNPDDLKGKMEELFGHEVPGLIPLTEDIAILASKEIFVVKNPKHPVATIIDGIAQRLLDK